MPLRPARALPFAATLLAATLTACAGSPSADPSVPPPTTGAVETGTPSVLPTPGPTAAPSAPTDASSPAAPAALTLPPSAEGAQDVARYFMELYPYVLRTGDVDPWATLSHPDCTTCSAVTEGAADPDPTSKQAVDIRSVTASQYAPDSWSVAMDMYETPRVSPDVVHFAVALELVHDGASWQVTSVRPVRQDS